MRGSVCLYDFSLKRGTGHCRKAARRMRGYAGEALRGWYEGEAFKVPWVNSFASSLSKHSHFYSYIAT